MPLKVVARLWFVCASLAKSIHADMDLFSELLV